MLVGHEVSEVVIAVSGEIRIKFTKRPHVRLDITGYVYSYQDTGYAGHTFKRWGFFIQTHYPDDNNVESVPFTVEQPGYLSKQQALNGLREKLEDMGFGQLSKGIGVEYA